MKTDLNFKINNRPAKHLHCYIFCCTWVLALAVCVVKISARVYLLRVGLHRPPATQARLTTENVRSYLRIFTVLAKKITSCVRFEWQFQQEKVSFKFPKKCFVQQSLVINHVHKYTVPCTFANDPWVTVYFLDCCAKLIDWFWFRTDSCDTSCMKYRTCKRALFIWNNHGQVSPTHPIVGPFVYVLYMKYKSFSGGHPFPFFPLLRKSIQVLQTSRVRISFEEPL